MPITTHPCIVLSSLGFTWPDGTPVVADLDLVVPPGRSALVGANGSGKSTLLRLVAGELKPGAGHVGATGSVGHLRQDLTSDPELLAAPVSSFLGLEETLAGLRAVEAGSVDPADFDAVGDDWDVEARVVASRERLGLAPTVLGRRLGDLSGGEVVQLGLARLLLDPPDVLLLDEPTNNLDASARERLVDVVASWPGSLLLVSHDRDLLEHVDRIGDLRDGRVRWYGGGYSSYSAQVAAEQEAASRAVDSARADVRRQRADQVEAERQLAQRRRVAARAERSAGLGKGQINGKTNQAEQSAAKLRGIHDDRLDSARGRLDDAEARLRVERELRVDLPTTEVPRGRVVLRCHDLVLRTGHEVDLDISGPDRVAVVGPNGNGKTTLLRTLVGQLAPASGAAEVAVPWGVVPQRLDTLDDSASVYANVAAASPGVEPNVVRSALARFLFRGASADAPAGTLSGGERLRAVLAHVLLARPAPQLLLLDEPTNNLDFAAYDALVSALLSYRGALIVVSHDPRFLTDLGIDRVLEWTS